MKNLVNVQSSKRLKELTLGVALCWSIISCSNSTDSADEGANILLAESFIDAFYSFQPSQLNPYFSAAANSAPTLLFYQGWAEGGNYKIVNRGRCEAQSNSVVTCPITVEDDPVLALNIDFNVTDTFTLTFEGSTLVSVETSSNDQAIYYDAFNWVVENFPDIMEGPCQGFFDGGPTPGDCARAMTRGYQQFAASDAYPN